MTATDVLRRLETVGPVPGRRVLYDAALDLEGRHIESVFHDDILEVLTTAGYAPERSVGWIDTADGRGLAPDIALPRWKVAVEAEGDSFHRTRDQRRTDRRRIAAYAATDWVVVPVDWRDWHRCQEFVLATIDAAIAGQRRRGIGRQHPAPPGV